jgi:hypothetical protein
MEPYDTAYCYQYQEKTDFWQAVSLYTIRVQKEQVLLQSTRAIVTNIGSISITASLVAGIEPLKAILL